MDAMDSTSFAAEAATIAMALFRKAAARAAEQLEPDYEPPTRRVDAILAFTRLSRCVERFIADPPAPPAAKGADTSNTPPRDTQQAAESRRTIVRDDLHRVVAKNPERRRLGKEIDRVLDRLIATRSGDAPLDLFDAVCDELGIPADHSKVSDELLGMPPRIYPDRDAVPPLDPDRFVVVPLPQRTD